MKTVIASLLICGFASIAFAQRTNWFEVIEVDRSGNEVVRACGTIHGHCDVDRCSASLRPVNDARIDVSLYVSRSSQVSLSNL